ncbi:MAG: cytochrome b/b6 domain-containing protein [Sulfuricaulis sp.]
MITSKPLHTPNEVKVWDPLVRVFHWSLVATFIVAWLTADEESRLHELAGYAVIGLVLVRIVWGFIGTRYARFTDFVHRPTTVLGYTREMLSGKPKHYLGHNPLGGMMILALMMSLLATGMTGLAMQQTEEGAGFFASISATVPNLVTPAMADDDEHERVSKRKKENDEIWEELHEFFANVTLLLVTLHIAGVIIGSLVHRENLVRAMLTGRKPA